MRLDGPVQSRKMGRGYGLERRWGVSGRREPPSRLGYSPVDGGWSRLSSSGSCRSPSSPAAYIRTRNRSVTTKYTAIPRTIWLIPTMTVRPRGSRLLFWECSTCSRPSCSPRAAASQSGPRRHSGLSSIRSVGVHRVCTRAKRLIQLTSNQLPAADGLPLGRGNKTRRRDGCLLLASGFPANSSGTHSKQQGVNLVIRVLPYRFRLLRVQRPMSRIFSRMYRYGRPPARSFRFWMALRRVHRSGVSVP